MTRLIKAHDPVAPTVTIHQVKRPAIAPIPAENVVSLEVLSLRTEVDELNRRLEQEREEVERLGADAVRLKADVARALQEGEDRGRKAGVLQGQEDRTLLVKTLGKAAEKALNAQSEALRSLDRLAPLLAREGLARLLEDPSAATELVTGIVRAQVAGIGAHSIVAVQVSATDFPMPAEELQAAVGVPGVLIETMDGLPSGDCRIRLALGEIEIGVNQQWGRLSALLLDLAGSGTES